MQSYKKTLESFIKQFPKHITQKMLCETIILVGFESRVDIMNDQRVKRRLKWHQCIIDKNYEGCQKLAALLEEMLG